MYFSQLVEAKKTIAECGYYRYRLYQDYCTCEECEEVPEESRMFVLENFYVDPGKWRQKIILKDKNGVLREAYFSDNEFYLNPILFNKRCEVVFSEDGYHILKLFIMVDRELFKVLETVYFEKNLGFELLIAGEFVEEPYWKAFEPWRAKREGCFTQQQEMLRRLLEESYGEMGDLLDIESVEFNLDEVLGVAEDVEAKEYVEEDTEDVLRKFPEWICLYENKAETDAAEVIRLGYEEDMFLDRVFEPISSEQKEIRLRIGENEFKTYFLPMNTPLWASMQYMTPIRIAAKVIPRPSGKEVLRIFSLEFKKSQWFNDFINQYLVGMDELKESDLVKFFEMNIS